MKTNDLKKGRSYTDKTGKIKRTIREIAKPENDHRQHVYFGEAGKMNNIPIQEFARWAYVEIN